MVSKLSSAAKTVSAAIQASSGNVAPAAKLFKQPTYKETITTVTSPIITRNPEVDYVPRTGGGGTTGGSGGSGGGGGGGTPHVSGYASEITPQVQDFSAEEAAIEAARQKLAQEEQANAKIREQTIEQRKLLENPHLLRDRGMGYLLVGEGKFQRTQEWKQTGTNLQQIEKGQQEIQRFRTEQITPAEQQIASARSEQAQYLQKVDWWNSAAHIWNDVISGKISPSEGSSRAFWAGGKVRDYYAQIESGTSTLTIFGKTYVIQPPDPSKRIIPPPPSIVTLPVGGPVTTLSAQDLFRNLGVLPPTVQAGTGQEKLYQTLGVQYQSQTPPLNPIQIKNLDIARYGTELSGTAITQAPSIPLSAYQPVIPSGRYGELVVSATPAPPSWFYPEGFPKKEEITKFTDIEKIIPNIFPRYYYEKEKIKSKYLTATEVSKRTGMPIEFAGLGEFAGGIVSAGIALGIEYPLYGLTRPFTTVKGLLGLPKEAISGFPTISEQVAPEFQVRPGYATGFAVTFLAGTAGRAPGTIEITRAGYVPKITAIPDEFTLKLPTITELVQPIFTTAKQEVPSPTKINVIETSLEGSPTARQSARLFLKDKNGNYILDAGGKESSKVISFGGKIEKGESPKFAALRELKEEAGLDLKSVKFEGKQVFPEEIFYVFTKTLTDEQIAQLKNVRYVSPSEARGITGQSAKYPIVKDNIRVYELALINWLETGEKPTWLYTDTPSGRYYYGTQSRYDITPESITAYADEELLLAHGSTDLPIVQRIFKKEFPVIKEAGKRGEPGLYLQPPTAKELPADVKKLIGYTGEGDFILPKEFTKLPFEVPTEAAPGYIGLSYLGLGESGKYQVGMGFGTRGALLFKEYLQSPIKATEKALKGIESEFLIKVGTEIKSTELRQIEYIGGKRIVLQPTKITKFEIINEPALKNLIRSSEEVLPKKLPRFKIPSYESVTKEKAFEFARTDERRIEKEINIQDKGVEITSEKYFGDKYLGEIISYEPKIPEFERPAFTYEYKVPYEPEVPKYPPYKPEVPKIPPRFTILGKKKKKEEYFKKIKPSPAYSVFLKRRGKFVPVRTGLPRGLALKYGASQVEKELSRQFKITKMGGFTEMEDILFKPSAAFRPYKVRRGKAIMLEPDRFIQRQKYALSSVEERRLIQQAKKQSKLMRGILP